ncbi:MAG: hypothetical protein JWM08_1159 [Candidatus Angelobacter sp.]|nr:hypothetical protein [Candidatus Angelobacter sp.]
MVLNRSNENDVLLCLIAPIPFGPSVPLDDRAPTPRFTRSGIKERTLPASGLQQITFSHGSDSQPLHGSHQILADFK